MSSETNEKCKSSSSISFPTFVALALLSVSVYQLAPDALKLGKEVWTKTRCRLSPPRGHLKPLGQQCPPMEPVKEITEWPNPKDFYRDYITASQPVLLKGLAKTIPAFHKWTDQYLMEKFGHEEVAVEVGLKQTDYSEKLYLNILSEFLKGYKEKGIYLVDTISPARFADVSIPKSIRCGNFVRGLSDIIMWLSNGNTQSIIHKDYVDNINCIFDGEKKVHLFQKEYTDTHKKDFSRSDLVDVDSVDVCEFPSYAQVPRYEITVGAGDCLFIPFQWYHYVAANTQRNLGLNFWFQHLNWFNETDCLVKDIESNFTFGAEDMPSAAQLKQFELLTYVGKEKLLDLKTFLSRFVHDDEEKKASLTKLFNEADTDVDGIVTPFELYQMEPNHFVSFFDEVGGLRFLNYTRDRGNLDPEDPNTTKNVDL